MPVIQHPGPFELIILLGDLMGDNMITKSGLARELCGAEQALPENWT